MSVGGTRIGSM